MIICNQCVNDTRNPTIDIQQGLCQYCRWYLEWYSEKALDLQDDWLEGKTAMIGLSGGKDSTATAAHAISRGIKLHGFTFDIGYYPDHIITQARHWADRLHIPHEVIDIRPHITPEVRECYRLTANFYEYSLGTELARRLYELNRTHYSVKKTLEIPYLRGCQLCRKVVIPAYYAEARKRGIDIVILGMNEWTHLSGERRPLGIRRLQPDLEQPAVYIVHYPFLQRWRLSDTQHILDRVGWEAPSKEELVETNGNSCCLARATQQPFYDLMGFHPDTTRLAREVTVGFLDRQLVLSKLQVARPYNRSVRRVLQDAGII